MICPVKKRVEEKIKFLLERVYPGKGNPAVKVGQEVSAATVIAHCEVSAGKRLIKIAHALGVAGKDVVWYLTRKIGDRIYEGEVIARKKSFLGLRKVEIKSPADGLITEIDHRGDVILKFLPVPVRLVAGGNGKVAKIEENKIVVETIATRVPGFVSIGKEREGMITVIADAKDFILPATIKADYTGKILVGGALLDRGALEKATALGVKGVITGGIHHKDFQALGAGGDIGINLMVTEGFGICPMGADVWEFFKRNENKNAFIYAADNQLVLPDSGEQAAKSMEKEDIWRILKVGDRVRFFREESNNLLGEVKELPGKQVLNSGILAEVAKVGFSGSEEVNLPAANLEIIE